MNQVQTIAALRVSFEHPGIVQDNRRGYMLVEEHSAGRKYSVWGPDYKGRTCRIGRYHSLGGAASAMQAMIDVEHVEGA
jgi:hypothetical protein